MVPKKPRANPVEKPEEEPKEKEKDLNAVISWKGIKGAFPLTQRSGEVLVYAVAFAIVVGVLGLVAAQIITALKMSGVTIKESAGFILWTFSASISAFLSRSSW